MISFIVIGQNIEATAEKCFSGIYKLNETYKYKFEVIYVDSKSTDKTSAIAANYPELKYFAIAGTCNAAIARNIGAKEAKGDILVFLDGDMELEPDFLSFVLDEHQNLKYDFVSGDLENKYYDENWQYLNAAPYFNSKLLSDRIEYTTGGAFIIKKELWDKVGGMVSYMRRSQDYDLGLRLAKMGYPLIRKKELFVYHHTISYFNKKRMIKFLIQGNYLYNGIIIRKHIFNKYYFRSFVRNNYSLIFLWMILLSCLFLGWVGLLIYPLFLVLRIILKRDKTEFSFFKFYVFLLMADIYTFIGIFYFPAPKEIEYVPVQCLKEEKSA